MWCIEDDTKISEFTQTDAVSKVSIACQTTEINIPSEPVAGISSFHAERSSNYEWLTSSDTSSSEGSSEEDDFVPSSSYDTDDSVESRCMLTATLAIMKKRPRHYMGINKSCLHIIGLLSRKTNLSEVKIMLTFRKIKLNEDFQTLADHFDINRRTAALYFKQSIDPIAKRMKKFLKYVKMKSIKTNLPLSFRRNYNDIGFILDCFETQIERPSYSKKQAKSFSPYKACNTVKNLVCITPDGMICYLSKSFGGRSSDLAITTACKLQKALKKKLSVMADRGFKGIDTVLLQNGMKLFRPPSASSDKTMSKAEVRLTKQIASLRIHVERAINRVRSFNMCKPHVTLDHNLIKHIDDIVVIVGGLCNMQQQLIKSY